MSCSHCCAWAGSPYLARSYHSVSCSENHWQLWILFPRRYQEWDGMLEDVIAPAMHAIAYWFLGGKRCAISAGIGTAFKSPWDLDTFLWR